MARFLDVHLTGGANEDTLKKMQNELTDEFGIATENIMYNIMYNIKDDRVFCLIEAPDKNAVEMHHAKYGMECEELLR